MLAHPRIASLLHAKQMERWESCTSTHSRKVVPAATLTSSRPCIDGQKLWQDIMETSRFGGTEPDGQGNGSGAMNRLAVTTADGEVRDWFVERAHSLGCSVSVDEMGNLFALLPGSSNSVPPIGIGSHLDTQPNGGRFDGILGVLAGFEVLRAVRDSGSRTFAPIVVINWTNEEGARFNSGCTGSAVWSHWISVQQGRELHTRCGSYTMQEALERIGFLGKRPCSYRANPLSAHLELHIEQNNRLEKYGKRVAVVSGIQGIRWFRVTVQGEQGHAGSQPMKHRADVFVATSKIVLLVEKLALTEGGVATVGVIESEQSSPNCVPGSAFFTIDMRHPSTAALQRMQSVIETRMQTLEQENAKLKFNLEMTWESPASSFTEPLLSCARNAASSTVGAESVDEFISHAGHDSALTALRVPTAMLFVPSRNGVSHHPDEFTSLEQCADGAQVLLDTVLNYDEMLRTGNYPSQDESVMYQNTSDT